MDAARNAWTVERLLDLETHVDDVKVTCSESGHMLHSVCDTSAEPQRTCNDVATSMTRLLYPTHVARRL
ncbi:unnamed protein product [Heligmosomoides polygyrus]|uniref:SRCR domain-containing protein n=1 Tax=Heligmosomoides polygyrus TaxID=6339 RepID=A0A183GA33_HELPZ|nr:unnamed protein product [Heligmosomoides polygyrus]